MYLMLPLLLALRATTVTAQFIGGYALFVNRTCPTGTLDCGPTVEYSGSPHACCPTGQVCHKWEFTSYGFVTACCATEKECREELEAANVCATDTWNLYIQGENHQFCCTPDLVGYATDLYKGYGKCVPRGTELEVGDSALNVKEQGLRGDSTSTPRPSGLTSRIGTSTQTSRGDATTTSDPSAASGLDRISTGTAPTVTVTGVGGAKSNGLSTGAIVGIVVGVVGVILLVVLGVVVWQLVVRRSAARGKHAEPPMGGIQS